MTSLKSQTSVKLNRYNDPKYRKGLKYSPQTGLFWKNYPRRGYRLVRTRSGGGYATIFYKGEKIRLVAHRMAFAMMGHLIPDHMEVDHINGIKHDNRWCNLRLVTKRDNQNNRPRHRNGRLPGCFFFKRDKNWAAQISINGKSRHIGYFATELLAHQAYIKAKSDITNLGELQTK